MIQSAIIINTDMLIGIARRLGGKVGWYDGAVFQWVHFMVACNPTINATTRSSRMQPVFNATHEGIASGYMCFPMQFSRSNVTTPKIAAIVHVYCGGSTEQKGFPTHMFKVYNPVRFWNEKRFNANKIIDHAHKSSHSMSRSTLTFGTWMHGPSGFWELRGGC